MAAKVEKGRFCPHCKAVLATSKKGWVYCPNKYQARACPFKGYPAGATTSKGSGVQGDIPCLDTPSDEQQAIFVRVGKF